MKAKISEIFKSIQGEGIYLGVLQVFVRFFGCSLACKMCDTPQGKDLSYGFKEYTADDLLDQIRTLAKGIHSVSLSGGEPLEQKEFLLAFLPLLKAEGLRTYLETNGVLPEHLKDIVAFVDIIAMDMKLPSATGQRAFWSEHERFLNIARQRDVFVKTVITLSTDLKDVACAAKLASKVNRGIVFILQPNYFELSEALLEVCQKAQAVAMEHVNDVRIIPQMHKHLGIR
ncbi:MAG: 7-carboxy-7-deazaguanine synthase QueE [Candidatus Omnitrophota bacterium]